MTLSEQHRYDLFLKETKDPELAKKLYVRWKILTDLYWFGSEVYGLNKAKGLNGRARLDPHIHRPMARDLQDDEDQLLIYPRLHMKTTWAKLSIVQRVLKNPFARVGLWSRTSRLVRKELSSIKSILALPVVREHFPDRVPDPGKNFNGWQKSTADELTVFRNPDEGAAPQENQVEVWGIEGTVTGHHYDVHYYDDIINEQSVTTPDQIEKVITWWQHIQAIKELSAVEKMTGTRYHLRDVYGMIMSERHFGTNYSVRRAIENGKPIYKFFSLKDLANLKRKMGNYAFSTQMMNDVLPAEDRLFHPPYPMWDGVVKADDDHIYYITIDPAPTVKGTSDYTGICIASVIAGKKDRLYFHKAYRVKLTADKLAAHIVDLVLRYRPKRVGIELGLQQALQYLININMRERDPTGSGFIRPQFVPLSIGKEKKGDRINRTLGAFIRDNRALFTDDMKGLFYQMEIFNPNTRDNDDDIVDAASMMIQTVEHFAPAQWPNIADHQFTQGFSGYTVDDFFKTAPKDWWGGKFVYGRV